MVKAVLERETGMLYLTCRASLQPFYERFGFISLGPAELTPYFRRLRGLFRLVRSLARFPEDLAVMRRG
jgi:hypothetical protein